MGRALALFTYKLRFFFGPSLRGRFGPLSYIALVLIFLPSGFLFGLQLGGSLRMAEPGAAIGLLSTPLAALLSFGLLYSLGAGITAHASEFDFFFTADVRPREYLVADLAFQFVSLLAAGGMAAAVAAVAMVRAVGLPMDAAGPLFAILAAYTFFVLMTSQVLVILRVRFPRVPVRPLSLVLLALSLLPAIGVAQPAFPIRFEALPLPSTAFGTLGAAALGVAPAGPSDMALALAYVGGIAAAWAPLSGLYIVHGLRPTLSAGFGQVDLGARLEWQRRATARLGRVTTRIRLQTDRGSDTALMARLHLVRIWRDGSILFVILFASIGLLPAGLGASEALAATIPMTQTLTFLMGILAINWSFYERENLWLVITAARPAGPYFRGLMLALAAIALAVTVAFLALVAATRSVVLPIESLALPIASPIAAAFVAAALLTRIKLRPSAFSFAALGVFFLVSLGGFLGGLAAQAVVFALRVAGQVTFAVQAMALLAFLLGLTAGGLWTVTRFAASFRL
jgi:hypothetical protein